MITNVTEARHIAENDLSHPRADGITARIRDADTIDHPLGWVFFYDCFDPMGTRVTLIGAGPLMVERGSGRKWYLPTGISVDLALARMSDGEI